MVAPGEGTTILEGGFGVVLKLPGAETGGSFSAVEHPLAPGVLGSPPHTHTNEDEYSFVVEGTVGVMVGEDVYEAGPGSYVIKPRGSPTRSGPPGPCRRDSSRSLPRWASSGTSRSSPRPSRRGAAGGAQARRDRRQVRPHLPLGVD